VRGEQYVLPKGETGGVGTRNPDARPATNYRGEASIDRDGPERKQDILSRKKENQFGAASALSWNVDRNYSPGMARMKDGARSPIASKNHSWTEETHREMKCTSK
jgi:hypothetical protein